MGQIKHFWKEYEKYLLTSGIYFGRAYVKGIQKSESNFLITFNLKIVKNLLTNFLILFWLESLKKTGNILKVTFSEILKLKKNEKN